MEQLEYINRVLAAYSESDAIFNLWFSATPPIRFIAHTSQIFDLRVYREVAAIDPGPDVHLLEKCTNDLWGTDHGSFLSELYIARKKGWIPRRAFLGIHPDPKRNDSAGITDLYVRGLFLDVLRTTND